MLALAGCLGFAHARTKGSHHILQRAGLEQTVNLLPYERDLGKAKTRQVEQLLKVYDDMGFYEER